MTTEPRAIGESPSAGVFASAGAAATAAGVVFARGLARHGDRVALIGPDAELKYRELAARVAAVGQRLGAERRLVFLAGSNTVEAMVAYLAALAHDHPVLLVPGDNPSGLAALTDAYDPDVVVTAEAGRLEVDHRRAASVHTLHPDLALLMSTSGSTGAAKLVRLSHDNLQSNATAIATFLGIQPSDRAATTLPMHYCYGLSVINSHLERGAALILTEASVADPEFWDRFRAHGGTSFAGVPHTFELLDRTGFDGLRLPTLRYLTQAGGRLAPDRVRHFAALGRRAGWDLFVMYGQTEATARIAYLPPDLAAQHPDCVGGPIPGGSVRLEPLPDARYANVGELVYTGPNVMLGYADSPADLALGRTIDELHTGDIAELTDDGFLRIVGRRNRFLKLFGLRLDLMQIEEFLGRAGITAVCTGDDAHLVVAVSAANRVDPTRVRRLLTRSYHLPAPAVRVVALDDIPRTESGKPDYPAILRAAAAPTAPVPGSGSSELISLYRRLLDRDDVTEDSTFVGLGGDSLSYVEMSIQLEQRLGTLPDRWETTPIRELRPRATGERSARRGPARHSLEMSVALRAVAIVLIVGTHGDLFDLSGSAHVLIGIIGFNFARFQLTAADRGERVRHLAASVARIAVFSLTWIVLVFSIRDEYSLVNFALGRHVFQTDPVHKEWHYWFISALLWILVAVLGMTALPWFDRLERAYPFALPAALAAVWLVARYQLVPGLTLPTPVVVFWFFAIGWAAARASGIWRRLLLTVAVLAVVPGFFGEVRREVFTMVGLLVLIWVARVPSTRLVNWLAGTLAAGTLFIYLTHFQVYPWFQPYSKLAGVLVSLAVGVVYGKLAERALRRLMVLGRRLRASSPL